MAIKNFISTVWSEHLYQELGKKYIAVAHCNRDFEGDIKEQGSVVRICGLDNVTVSPYTKNANMEAPTALSDNYRELVIDQAKYFNFQIDDIDRAQSSPKLMELAMKNAANALADDADKYIFSLHPQISACWDSYDTTAENIIETLIDARTAVMKNSSCEPSDLVIEVSPEIGAMILKGKIGLATDNTDALEKGCIGSIGGCKIYVSNNIQTVADEEGIQHKCFVRTKRAIAFAEQLSEIDAYRPELRFADAVKGLHLYGAKLVYPKEAMLLNLNVIDRSEE
ncbi:MAG: P22 coat protein - protein 5 domain protein [Clostridia bacterium]|nr:P22 coat protein - protein 5 domain protein [Clostridia bacterium]